MIRIHSLILSVAVALALALAWSPALVAQSSEDMQALRKEIEDLKKGQTAIQRDLQAIKVLLSANRRTPDAAPKVNAVVDLAGQPFKGAEGAKLVLVEFSDYQ